MPIVKQSFISNLIGENTYKGCLEYAKPIVGIGICVLAILYVLTQFFHSGIINYLVSLSSGTSLLFIGFVVEIILLFDITVEVEEPDSDVGNRPKKIPKPWAYKLTIVWGVVLILLGIAAIYSSNEYRNQYAFECDTFLVDHEAGVYHLDWNTDCEKAEEAESLEVMKGYQINNHYMLCDWCKETLEEVDSEY